MGRHEFAYIGFGISVEPFKHATDEGISKVMGLLSENTRKYIEEIGKAVDIRELEFECDGDPCGIGGMVAEAMSLQEEIYFCHATADYDDLIIFEPYYPWYKPRPNEATLTEEKLVDLFYKYQTLLGIPEDKQEQATYWTVTGYC